MKSQRSNGKPWDIYERTTEYSVDAIRLCQNIPLQRDTAASVIVRQYLRCATSIGANLAEAKAAESKPDFIHKFGIAQKEARECEYWLTLLVRADVVTEKDLAGLAAETKEIYAIITAIIVKAKKRDTR